MEAVIKASNTTDNRVYKANYANIAKKNGNLQRYKLHENINTQDFHSG